MAPKSGYFDVAFALDGNVATVPDAIQPDGSVSYTAGFAILYSTPVASGGINFPRAQFNQLMLDITSGIQFLQQNGASNFITDAMTTDGSPFSYNLGATVMYDAGGGIKCWISTAAANTTVPGAGGAHWVPLTTSPIFIGGASTGSANAQAVTTDQGDFTNTAGNIITFKAGFSCTGAATLAPDSASAINLKVGTASGLRATMSGDIVSGVEYIGISDGTNIQILNPTALSQRQQLTTNTSFFVATTGNDSNPGTSGSPWLTIQHAFNYLLANIDLAGFTATIKVADGTYTGAISIGSPFTGGGMVQLTGNASTPANCILSTTSNDAISVSNYAIISIQGFKIQTTSSGVGLIALNGGQINVNGTMNYGACASAHMDARGNGSAILISADYTISGASPAHQVGNFSGLISGSNLTITITGTPAFSSEFASADLLGLVTVTGNTYSGAATGTRYSATGNGVINTAGGGATYLPGNGAGSTGTGGQYI